MTSFNNQSWFVLYYSISCR